MAKSLHTAARIESLREKIEVLKVKRRETKLAPLPRAECAALIRASIAAAAAEWRAALYPGPVAAYPPTAISLQDLDAPPAVVAPDALEAALLAARDEQYRGQADGLPARERPAALAALDAQILEAEIAEEQLIVEAERNGHAVDRRADADPRAVLAVA